MIVRCPSASRGAASASRLRGPPRRRFPALGPGGRGNARRVAAVAAVLARRRRPQCTSPLQRKEDNRALLPGSMGRSVTQLRPRSPSSLLPGAGHARFRNPQCRRFSAALGDDVASCRVGPQSDDLGPTTRRPGAHRLTTCAPWASVARDAPPVRGECAADRPAAPPGSVRRARAARRRVSIPAFSLKRKKHNRAVAPLNMGRWTCRPRSRGPSSLLFDAGLGRPRNLRRRRASAAPDDDVPPGNVAPQPADPDPKTGPLSVQRLAVRAP